MRPRRVRFITLGKARSLRDDVGPLQTQSVDRSPSPTLQAASVHREPRITQRGEASRPESDSGTMAIQTASRPSVQSRGRSDLGEPDEDGERRRARPEERRAGLGSDLLAIGSDDDETEPRYEGKAGKEGDPATWTVHECPFRRGADREGIFSAILRQEAREGLFAGGSSTVSLTCRVGGVSVRDRSGIPGAGTARRLERRARPRRSRGDAPAAPDSKMVSIVTEGLQRSGTRTIRKGSAVTWWTAFGGDWRRSTPRKSCGSWTYQDGGCTSSTASPCATQSPSAKRVRAPPSAPPWRRVRGSAQGPAPRRSLEVTTSARQK